MIVPVHLYSVALLCVLSAASVARAETTACQPQDGPAVCKQKCESRSQESCAVLGILYLRGDAGRKPAYAKAEPLLRTACAAKVALGCGGLGSLYALQKKVKKARPLFEKACKMGDALSCESIGGLILGADGSKPPSDLTAATRKANVYYERACELGSPSACAFCAAFIVDKIVQGTAQEALELYLKACSGGIGMACRQGADFLMKDTPESKQLAATLDAPRLSADLLKRACELGDSNACARRGE
jgi:uncharacterized protein